MIDPLMQSVGNFLFPSRCFVCKKNDETLCASCLFSMSAPLDTPHYFIYSKYSYKDKRLRRVMHAIKFFHRKDLAHALGKEVLPLLPPPSKEWLLVPIPMHPIRKILRGYNQTEVIAGAISNYSTFKVDKELLYRTKYSARQVRASSKAERLRNQKSVFGLRRSCEGLSIILIDDVTTTGATLNEARNLLLKSKAAEVIAITIAH